ncbi:DNA polymerase III subunit delta [Usitatibacter palustris]|uniref:DNA polymerase III subunit delta n=1 Tax=Usitatibacter palustris TaxID=2732487 RepID=A0A6M4H1K7_9PROT|nr:DNA polymerase III subunit delta [Usitatibacter palustris]QJR13379.1 hypothetical protein DSM104440_00162 [Usitatibacter palustris]
MKISTRQLPGALRKGLSSLYVLYGPETLLALEAADRIRDAARADGYTEREVFFAEPGCDWNRLGASASNLSLFSTKRLFEIRIPTGKPGVEGAKALTAWAGKQIPDTMTMVMLPEIDWQQAKSVWFTALEGAGVGVEAKAVTREELPEWLAERLALGKQRGSAEVLEGLADRVEGNLLAAKQEVEKLALLLPEGEITLEAIGEAVTDVSRFERDALIDAIHAQDGARMARVLQSLEAEGEPLPLLLWQLCDELRTLMTVAAGQRPRRYLTPDRQARVAKTARRHDAASFARELLRAHRIDRMMKGVETGDPWGNMLEMALGLSGRPVLAKEAA